jgi:polyketide synthase PksN
MLSKTGMLSPTGRCRTFDSSADGLVPAEGVAVVVLKPLAAALRDRNPIYGVIKACEANQDGKSNGITAPSSSSQTALEIDVYRKFGISPETIGYVETHGTGTKLGDPIEVNALTDAFAALTDKKGFCPIGSVKTNIGHTLAASGAASLIKVLLCLQERTLVPSLHFTQPSGHIDFGNSPFYVNTTRRQWLPNGSAPRRAAVSSFGMSGTNVHLIVEEAPPEAAATTPTRALKTLIPLSAKTPAALRQKVADLIAWLDGGGLERELGDIGYTLGFGRSHFPVRVAFVAASTGDLRRQLAEWLECHPAGPDAPAEGRLGSALKQLAGRLVDELRDPRRMSAEAYGEGLAALADVYVNRHEVDWAALYSGQGRRLLSLPTYPFQTRRHWVEEPSLKSPLSDPTAAAPTPVAAPRPAIAARVTAESDAQPTPIFYFSPSWRAQSIVSAASSPKGPVLLFDSGDALRPELVADGGPLIVVERGERGGAFRQLGERRYRLDPDDEAGYFALAAALAQRGLIPRHVLYLWPLAEANASTDPTAPFFAIASLCRAFADHWLPGGETTRILYLYRDRGERLDAAHAAVEGFARSLHLDLPHLRLKTVGCDAQSVPSTIVLAEMGDESSGAVRYQAQERHVEQLAPFGDDDAQHSAFRHGGVYLITGGLGGLGRVFAEHLASRYQAKLVLCGRTPVSSASDALLGQLTPLGGEAIYLQVDVAHRQEVFAMIGRIEARFGALHGILHAAGHTADASLRNKTRASMTGVLAPKLWGALHLDDATRHCPLDLFAMFSSTTAVLGNMGQADYGYANRFLDCFAGWREAERRSGRCSGRTVSINWPLWRDGGMSISPELQTLAASTIGMAPLTNEAGLTAAERAIGSSHHQVLVMVGDETKIERALGVVEPAATPASSTVAVAHAASDAVTRRALEARVKALLVQAVSNVLKVAAEDVDYQASAREYGLESINVVTLVNHLNQSYGLDLTPVRFFEHSSLASLGKWLCAAYEEHLLARLGIASPPPTPPASMTPLPPIPAAAIALGAPPLQRSPEGSGARPPAAAVERVDSQAGDAVAIIGISGILPGSPDVDAFFRHLDAGDDLVGELPVDRWDWRAHDDGQPNRKGLRFGGFCDDIDKFDPAFFGVSPREAELMDPQQRVILQTVWKAIEDAGYKASDIGQSDTGVFIGAATADYLDLLDGHRTDAYALTGTTRSILANRVSFFFDLRGPSEAIDTACSSALVAIHRAAEAVRSGTSSLAIAGAVNAILGPTTALAIAKAGMLSPDGKCKTFDESANGYVRAEGAGALVLKSLRRALADGDHVYAVIKGSAENHGGRASSLTAPNPRAQADVIVSAMRRAGVAPTTVGYIETHGTGTALGDPIEINGLKMAFERLYQESGIPATDEPHCALGSVKTNVGHLEAAAGIPSVFKVLLAMRHRRLPGNLHLQKLNPYLELAASPFRILTASEPWEPMVDSEGRPLPLRAGVSSFGFGGANAHLVLEAFDDDRRDVASGAEALEPQLIVLSAKNEDRLRAAVDALIAFHRDGMGAARPSLASIAHTLLIGREAMPARLACVARDVDELIAMLSRHRAAEPGVDGIFTGVVGERDAATSLLLDAAGEEGRELIAALHRNRKLAQLARLWVAGAIDLAGSLLFAGARVKRVPLPTYQFAPERYWVPARTSAITRHEGGPRVASGSSAPHAMPHPMIDARLSSSQGAALFQKTLTADAFYLQDHVVAGKVILPGVGHLELARTAGELAGGRPVRVLRDVMWVRPIVLAGPRLEVQVAITPDAEGAEYQISHVRDGRAEVYSRGKLDYEVGDREMERYDLDAIMARLSSRESHDSFYRRYRDAGFHYGPSFRVNQEVYGNQRESLGRLVLPAHLREQFSAFGLHPSLLDASLQAISGMRSGDGADMLSLRVPFALGRLEIFAPLPATCFSYATLASRRGAGDREIVKFNVAILDDTGSVLARITDFSARALKPAAEEAPPTTRTAQPLSYYASTWSKTAL